MGIGKNKIRGANAKRRWRLEAMGVESQDDGEL